MKGEKNLLSMLLSSIDIAMKSAGVVESGRERKVRMRPSMSEPSARVGSRPAGSSCGRGLQSGA